jgi:hypothetical protein
MKRNFLILGFVALLAMFACASAPPPPHAMPAGAIALSSEPRMDEFNCPADNCVHWYKIDVPKKGKLRVFVESFELEDPPKAGFLSKAPDTTVPVGYEVTISAPDGKSIAGAKSAGKKETAVETRVTKGSYMLSVWSEEPGRAFGYRLTSKFRAAPRPKARVAKKPRPPQFESRAATILEAEGWGEDVEAVLIDLGSTHGMTVGLKGRLIDEGDEIGKVTIKQVYPDGSRAGVDGALTRPLGPDSRVEILIPID